MSVVWAFLILMLIGYIAVFTIGLISIGLKDVVPVYLFTVTSFVIMFLSVFKAGAVIFQKNTYETLISMPVSRSAIVVSRFLSMYVTNLMLSCFVMFTGTVLYGIWARPAVSFYIYSIAGTLFLPLLPMTVSALLGALITAVSSRMKHKSLVASVLSIILVLGFMFFNYSSVGNADKLNEEMLKNFSAAVMGQIEKLYPPAVWFGKGALDGNIIYLLLLIGLSLAVFLAMVFIIQRYFSAICTALNSTSAKKNYRMRELNSSSPLKAMFFRELKRYFASSIYVTNTIIGYILMAAAAVALFVMGPDKLETALGFPGVLGNALPLFLAAIASITTPASCSVSMEGKQWWIAKTIPVRSKDIFDSKILVSLAIALPEYIVAVIFSLIAIKPDFTGALLIIVVPAVYILYTAVAGISINLAMPVLEWENEVRVVKQSASVMVTMLAGLAGFVPPIICVITFKSIPAYIIMFITVFVIAAVTAVLYARNNRKNVLNIGE